MRLAEKQSRAVFLLLPFAGLLAGLLLSLLVTPRYVSTAVVALADTGIERNPALVHHNLVEFFIRCQSDVLGRTSLSELIQSPPLDLYSEERQKEPVEDVIEDMRRKLKVELIDQAGYPRESTTVFRISFSYRDPVKAQATVQQVITRFIDQGRSNLRKGQPVSTAEDLVRRIERLEAKVAAFEAGKGAPSATAASVSKDAPATAPVVPITFSVLGAAELPASPVYPNRLAFSAAGFAFGCTIALIIAGFRRLFVRSAVPLAVLMLTIGFASAATGNDWLVVPGVRVGPITRDTTRADLARLFGSKNLVDEEVTVTDVAPDPGTILYGNMPAQRLTVVWDSTTSDRKVTQVIVCAASPCRWHTAEGVTGGVSLKQLETINRHSFELTGFGYDYGGTIISWSGGSLSSLSRSACGHVLLRLDYGTPVPGRQEVERQLDGDRNLTSAQPAMQTVNPSVRQIAVFFDDCRP